MANKNTKARNRANRAKVKRGAPCHTDRQGKWRPILTPEMVKQVTAIREQSKRVYGQSA